MNTGGGSRDVPGISMVSFVSQDDIESARKKRQEEWERKRTEDQPLECPEEEVDNRSLYEKLQEQKIRQQEEYEEKHRLKNTVQGIDEDEAGFLEYVSKKQVDLIKARNKEEKDILKEIEEASVSKITDAKLSEDKKSHTKPQVQLGGAQNKKSQMALLAGAVKRKSSDPSEDSKKRKISSDDSDEDSPTPLASSARNGACQTARIIGILPGLGAYNNDSSDSASSSDDSDIDLRLTSPKKYVVVDND